MKFRLIICFILTLTTVKAQEKLRQGDVPNVVFIMASDINDWIGALEGHPDVKTPNLDELAKRGILFRNAHAASPDKGPSRMAMMSGLNPSTTGLYKGLMDMKSAIGEREILPEYFRNNGYNTYRSGVINNPNNDPVSSAWDDAFPSMTEHLPPLTIPKEFIAKGNINNYRWDTAPLSVGDTQTDDGQIVNWAITQFQKNQDAPFFMAVGLTHARLPWVAPKAYFDMYPLDKIKLPNIKERDLDDVPAYAKSKAVVRGGMQWHKEFSGVIPWRKKVQAYLACISFVDAQVGRLIKALEDSDYGDDTIIVFCSDNGFHLGEKQMWNRFSLWEEVLNVPLIISGGRKIDFPQGAVVDVPVSLVNIYPTLLSLCELPKNNDLDGVDMTKFMFDFDPQWNEPALSTYLPNDHALLTKKWKYISWSDGSEELYDIQNDPHEWINLAGKEGFSAIKDKLAWYFPEKVASLGKAKGKRGKKGKKGKKKTN